MELVEFNEGLKFSVGYGGKAVTFSVYSSG